MKYDKEEIREKYKDLFEYSLDLIYVNDLRGNFLDANEIALKNFGFKKEELPKMSFRDFLDKAQLEKLYKFAKEMIEKGKQLKQCEYQLKTKDGRILYIESYGIPLKKNGKIYAILGVGKNITERKEVEQKLRASELKYRHLFESSPFSISLLDLQGNVLYSNNATNNFLLTHNREFLIGKNFKDLFFSNKRNKSLIPLFEKKLKRIIQGEITESFEFPLRKLNGSIMWINLNGSLIQIENEILIQIIVQDITEMKKAEQKLIESEKKYRFIFENSPYSIFLLNLDGIIIDCNPTTERLVGYKRKELIGRHFNNASIIHPKYIDKVLNVFEEFVKGKKLDSIEFQLYKKDGNLIWVNSKASFVKIGQKNSIQVIFHDITERKNAEVLIKEEIEKLKELDKIRKDLIIRVSHELKTPLIPVCGGAELLLYKYKDQLEKDLMEIVKLIKSGGERLKRLIEKLIDISRLEVDTLTLEKQITNLSELIRNCSNEMKYLIKERKISLNLDLPNDLYIDIDCLRIEQVITNLLSNAIKNTPPKGKITIILEKIDNWVKITISDTGVGLTQEEIDVLFTRFGKIERDEKGLEYI
ncbi:MAG: PAS domain S-box protein, partial [Promethearchaeota archaeon]